MQFLILLLLLFAPIATLAQQAEELSPFERDLLRYRSAFEYGGFEPDLSSILPAGRAGRWTLSAGLEGTYTDNLDLDSSRRDAFYLDGTAGLGWLKLTPRFQGSLDYRFRTDLYESDAVSEQDHTGHRVTGALEWLAGPHWTLSGGGHFAQEVESGVEETAPGVRSSYNNRFNEYGAHGRSEGQLSRTLSNELTYAFRYRNYIEDGADGDDTRSHRAGTRFAWQARPRDSLSLGYDYVAEDDLTTSVGRRTHLPTAVWTHRFVTFPTNRMSTLDLAYEGDRTLGDESPDYWSHSVYADYAAGLSPRTTGHVLFGYQWILPDQGDDEQNFRYGGGVDHRFSEWTTLRLSGSQSWEYVPASSRSEFTTLTRVTRFDGVFSSRLSRDLRGELSVGHEQGDVRRDLSGPAEDAGDYWQTTGRASLTVDVRRSSFVGADYTVTRRSTDGSEDDYLLHRAGFFVRTDLVEWLVLSARYSYENRSYDASSRLESYRENRVSASLAVTL